MDDRQTIFGRQSVLLSNLFVAEDIVHYLPKFVATWNPPFKVGIPHGDRKRRKCWAFWNFIAEVYQTNCRHVDGQ